MNRRQRRAMAKLTKGQTEDVTNVPFRLRYDVTVPGGSLRSAHEVRVAGVIEAANEGDLLRGIFLKLLDTYGYTNHFKAISGVIGDVFGPFPANIKGHIAYALIEGLGLSISESEEEVCQGCGKVKTDVTDPHDCAGPDGEPVYKQEPVTLIFNPRFYQGLAPAGGNEISTVESDDSVVYEFETEDGDGERGPAEVSGSETSEVEDPEEGGSGTAEGRDSEV